MNKNGDAMLRWIGGHRRFSVGMLASRNADGAAGRSAAAAYSAAAGRSRASRGFTLVELMIVVCIIGVLAALAVFGVRSYVNAARTAEAVTNISRVMVNPGKRPDWTTKIILAQPCPCSRVKSYCLS